MKLNVDLLGRRAGALENESGTVRFVYLPEYVESDGLPLSISLPKQAEPFSQRATLAYFGNLLPEGDYRDLVAQSLRVSPGNPFALLAEIGRDCAGAVVITSEDDESFDGEDLGPQWLSGGQLDQRLHELTDRAPQRSGPPERMSLAGAQAKLAVIRDGARFAIPRSWRDPTTHILKPSSQVFPEAVENEGFCMRLAELVGLPVAETEISFTPRDSFLMIRRFDRDPIAGTRLHQEDFCQALGIPAEAKYEDEGGPSIRDLFAVVDTHSGVPARDKLTLWRAIVFNILIGNCDAHGKNFSLLYESATPSLAPLYDLISTEAYDLTDKLAMRIGSARFLSRVTRNDLSELAEQVGLSRSNAMRELDQVVSTTVGLALRHIELDTHDSPIVAEIRDGIVRRASQLALGG